MRDDESFGPWLKQYRLRLDLTQAELAARATCATETVRKLEAGSRRPSRAIAHALADALDLQGAERLGFLRRARQPREVMPVGTTDHRTGAGVEATHDAGAAGATQSAPLLTTKLYLPRPRTELVARPRLMARLDAGVRGALTLIAAPAGFGKTTLLADWLSHPAAHRANVAWIALDASDSDPIQFLRYLIAAFQTLHPSVGATVLPLLRSVQTPPLEALVRVLVNDLVALPPGSVLVLDDYHVIDSATVHQVLASLLEPALPTLHIVIATRTDPPFPLARWRARGQLVELRAGDLRFTTDEAAVFLQQVMGLPLTAEDVAAVEARTEGWIAGLQLAALSLQDRPTAQLSTFIDSFTGSHRFVVDYLVDEVLARQPASVQHFLLHTAILERMCGPLCTAVIAATAVPGGLDGAPLEAFSGATVPYAVPGQLLLEQLDRANLFVVPLDEERRWYRYHHLFAQVLQERLLARAGRAAVAALHGAAARWLEGHGLVVDAVQHVMAARDWPGAARLIEAHGRNLITQGQVQTVRGWLSALPEPLLQRSPYLLDLQAVGLYCANELDAAERTIQAAEHALGPDMPPEYARSITGYAALLRANIARSRGELAAYITLSGQALGNLPVADAGRRSTAMLGAASTFLVRGDVGLAQEQGVAAAVAAARAAGNLLTEFNGLVALAELHRRQGRLRAAQQSFGAAADVAPGPVGLRGIVNGAAFAFGLGDLLREQNELERAAQLLDQGRAMVREGLVTHADVVTRGYVALARTEQQRGEDAAARATLQELRALARERRFAVELQTHVAAAEANLALQQGDFSAAWRWAEQSGLSAADEVAFLREEAYLTLARIWIAQARAMRGGPYLADALRLLEQLQRAAEAGTRWDSGIQIMSLRTLALDAQGTRDESLETLDRVVQRAAPEGYVRVFVDCGPAMATLLAARLATRRGTSEPRGAEPHADVRAYVARLLRICEAEGMAPELGHDHATAVPQHRLPGGETLTERELEVMRLLAAGRSNQAIAQELVVAVGTVKRHVSNIIDKLAVESRLEAVARARDIGLI